MTNRRAFHRFVDAVHRRRVIARLIEGGACGVLAGCVAGSALALLSRGGGVSTGSGGPIISITAIVVWMVAVTIRWPRRREAARIIDEHLSWSELLASAESCAASPQDPQVAAMLFARADSACHSTRPGVIPVGRFTRRRWAMIGLGIAAAGSIAVLLPQRSGPAAVSAGAETLAETEPVNSDDSTQAAQRAAGSHSAAADSFTNDPAMSSALSASSAVSEDRTAVDSAGAHREAGGVGPGAASDPTPARALTVVPPGVEHASVLKPSDVVASQPSVSDGVGPSLVGVGDPRGAEPSGRVRGAGDDLASNPRSASSLSLGASNGPLGRAVSAASESAVPPSLRDLVGAFHDAGRGKESERGKGAVDPAW